MLDFNAMFAGDDDLLTPEEVANKIRVSRKTVARKRLAGEFEFVEISPRIFRYPKKSIAAYLNSRYQKNSYLN